MLRRAVLTLAVLTLASAFTLDPKPTPELWLTTDATKTTPKAVEVTTFGGKTTWVVLAKQIPTTSVDVFSIANDNSTLRLAVRTAKVSTEAQWPVVGLGGRYWKAESKGSDDTGEQASFTLDRGAAGALAAAFGVAMHDRTRLDADLRYVWTIPGSASANAPITVQLRVENAGKTTVGLVIGGRQRGPRDNRFSFAITRDGKPVALLDGDDFGGRMYSKKLAPSEHAEIAVDLRSWATFDQPGHYEVRATYEGELTADGIMPSASAADRATIWDIAPTEQGTILVP